MFPGLLRSGVRSVPSWRPWSAPSIRTSPTGTAGCGCGSQDRAVYVHDGMAHPREFVQLLDLPSRAVLDNPNYGHLCTVCLDGRERHVPDCRPEWNCSHVMHQRG